MRQKIQPPILVLIFTIYFILMTSTEAAKPQHKTGPATVQQAQEFVSELNQELKKRYAKSARAEWIKSNFITDDTEKNAADINEELMAYIAKAIVESNRFKNLPLDADTQRQIRLLQLSNTVLSPQDPKKRERLTELAAKLEGMYGKAKVCSSEKPESCKSLGDLEDVLKTSQHEPELLWAWKSWHDTAKDMRPLYSEFVELANDGAKGFGFSDNGQLWKSGYDMPADAFEKETDRLWKQVKPLYDELHCYTRAKLNKKYGDKIVPPNGPIPAHLTGNMWGQDWSALYPLLEPYQGQSSLDVSKSIVRQKLSATDMARKAESFFLSLGFDPLPKTFWERSLFTKPKDRDVVCHASAWDITYENDSRIKMCIKPNEEDFTTLHHELGHNYYYQSYFKRPVLYQQGANDGFHEAIGDTIALSMTPNYFKQLGLLKEIRHNQKVLINEQMKRALEKVAFLPFGKMIDQWRWDVFSGKTKAASYNKDWWDLKLKYQGLSPSVARSEMDFDPGAKYHVAGNVPYTRYFLAHILQFQFHRALCKEAGNTLPIHECSIYGNKNAGKKLQSVLELGSSQPWQVALEKMTGQREMDATAILDYFSPLYDWLKKENQGKSCSW